MQAPATNPAPMSPFHLAFPVHDLAPARQFYGQPLGCPEGRSSDEWIDFDFYGHQIVAHLAPAEAGPPSAIRSMATTCRCGTSASCCRWSDWQRSPSGCKARGIDFLIEPYIRFQGQPGEQATMFFLDPSGNALEIKAFADIRCSSPNDPEYFHACRITLALAAAGSFSNFHHTRSTSVSETT